jgi:hypothetical protein
LINQAYSSCREEGAWNAVILMIIQMAFSMQKYKRRSDKN